MWIKNDDDALINSDQVCIFTLDEEEDCCDYYYIMAHMSDGNWRYVAGGLTQRQVTEMMANIWRDIAAGMTCFDPAASAGPADKRREFMSASRCPV